MQYTVKDLPKSMKEIKVEFPAAELQPYMEAAAQRLSQQVKIEGFRPGKASYDVMKGRVGEGAILEEALPRIVQKSLVEAITKEQIPSVGEPTINVEKAAPGNDIIFTAKLAVLPMVKQLADLGKISVDAKPVEITDEEVGNVIEELRSMKKTERDVEREVKEGDKIVVDLEMKQSGVTVEGGTAKDHGIYLDQEYYVPGFREKVLGMKAGDSRDFTLKFPDEHFQKNLAGKDVEFHVEVKKVQELLKPEANDEFAQQLGKQTMDELRDLLRKNLEQEGLQREQQRQEQAVLEAVIEKSEIDEIPELIVTSEAQRMLHEYQHSVERQGVAFDDYLAKVGKSKQDLLLDFTPDAVKRAKTAILVREIAKAHEIQPTDQEVVDEQTKMLNMYKDDAETQEKIRSDEGMDYLRTVIRNRKVMAFLREKCVKASK